MSATLQEAPDRPEGAADDGVDPTTAPPEGKVFTTSSTEVAVDAAELASIANAAHETAVGTQFSLLAGGETPTESQFKLAGRSLELPDEYEKGADLVLRIGVKIGEVDFIDHEDKETGQVVKTIRRHKAKIVSYDVE
jgi:hypothetical protein